MIVIETDKGREVIFQRNHALLAGALAVELAPQYRPKAWVETLTAVLEHDDGQSGFTEETHIDRKGGLLGFRNFGENLLQAERVVQEAYYKSKYVMLLVSMHAHALRSPKEVKSPELKAYLARQEALQKTLKSQLKISDAEAQEAYLFLRWCDECSLVLCENRLTQKPFQLQTGFLPGIEEHYISQDMESQLVRMEPWCFQSDSFSVSAEIYHIPGHQPFESSVALQHTLHNIAPATRSWTFSKA